MAADRPTPPARRHTVHLVVDADSLFDAGALLLTMATDLMVDDLPTVDRYYVGEAAEGTGHLVATERPEVTADSYQAALREWARETLRTHPRPELRPLADDPLEPF